MNPLIERLKEALHRISTPEPRSLDTSFVKNEVKPDFTVEQFNYVMAAAHAVPELITYIETLEKRVEAGSKLAEEVRRMEVKDRDIVGQDSWNDPISNDNTNDEWREKRDAAIAAYQEATKE